MLTFLNRIISWSFYALFLLVPLVFTSNTSELFELNKMWLTWGLATIIIAAWLIKMLFTGRFRIQRTPLDIPIGLFFLSQLISTIVSLDPHTSFWGYYSRFNGGLLSFISYILLYYAFVSNIEKEHLMRYVYTLLLSGVVVALWGLPSHFGYDPTCLVFRGTFDVSCWTFAFQPKVRIFSTLGQPDWLSAYLAALIPVALGITVTLWEKRKTLFALGSLLATFLFYLDFLYAKSRGGFVGLALSLFLFVVWYIWYKKLWLTWKNWRVHNLGLAFIAGIVIITFFVGTSIDQLDKFITFSSLQQHFITKSTTVTNHQATASATPKTVVSTGEFGGTDSGKIRLFVWSGAIDAWLHYPIFGTGVETFAYAYYLFMPAGHNMTSEFGYLYNKAHNEYLNFLATTGIVGLATYLFMIGWFLWIAGKRLFKNKQLSSQDTLLLASFIAAYIGILITNFFGFSVVIINLFLFLFPGFIFLFGKQLDPDKEISFSLGTAQSSFHWILSGGITLVAAYFLYILLLFWNADVAYALGQNYVNAGDYQNAYEPLHKAIEMRSEPTFQDTLALDDAVLAAAIFTQDKTATSAATQLTQEAIAVNDNLVMSHPNIVTYWKTRVRIMYALSQTDPKYMGEALTAIQKAAVLAPTDAKVSYNLGLIYGQTGHYQQAIDTLQNTIKLKKDYRDAYYALGLYYHSAAIDTTGRITNPEYAQNAIDEMHFILDNFNSKDEQALTALKAWNAN